MHQYQKFNFHLVFIYEIYLIIYAENLFNIYPELNKHFPGNESPFILLSDEWYILSNTEVPQKKYYGQLDLIENGVGQVRSFIDNFYDEAKCFPKKFLKERTFSIVTGEMAGNIFKEHIMPVINKKIQTNFNCSRGVSAAIRLLIYISNFKPIKEELSEEFKSILLPFKIVLIKELTIQIAKVLNTVKNIDANNAKIIEIKYFLE